MRHLTQNIAAVTNRLAAPLLLLALSASLLADAPFNGRDLTGWKTTTHPKQRSHWTAATAALDPADPRQLTTTPGSQLVNVRGYGLDLYTEKTYADVRIEAQVMVPKGANSGIYLMGEYEVQILDSYGVSKPGIGDMGAIYRSTPPTNPTYKQAGQWQTITIDFRAPRFDNSGRKTQNARFVKVTLNGKTIHANVDIAAPTPGGLTGKEQPAGPLLLEGKNGPVAFQSLRITPLP
ncbi:MAG: 3-keto-disaccharide hydrolase [Planctomycetota bacterium]